MKGERGGRRKAASQGTNYGTVYFDEAQAEEDLEPKVDMTQSLPVHSKKSQRQSKKLAKKSLKASSSAPALGLFDMPYEIFMQALGLLRPSDIITLLRVNQSIRNFILSEEKTIARDVIHLRYNCLSKCFRRPVLLRDVDPVYHAILQSPDRPETSLRAHKRTFHHIQQPNQDVICTCLTCVQRWNSLGVVVDFAYWQPHLEKGDPLPIVPRGHTPKWNESILQRNTVIILKALDSDLFYARILQLHLDSTVRSIRRHSQNRGNRRRRFRMTDDDIQGGTADFLERSGPPTVVLPHNRDDYYMLEAFMPNRSWITERNVWVYLPEDQHGKDLEIAVQWEAWAKSRQERRRLAEETQLRASEGEANEGAGP
ncbi:hypothetical protein V8F20_010145 [Naviculisporaceae sp. PSN 640]